MSPKRKSTKRKSQKRHSPKHHSPHKKRQLLIAVNNEAHLVRGTKNGPILGGNEIVLSSDDSKHLFGGEQDYDFDGGAKISFPKPKSWSWTQFNKTVSQSVDNLLYWKPQFSRYFQTGAIVIGAFKSNATYFFSERNVIELIVPREDNYIKKLVVCFVISKGTDDTKYYSATAYEVPIKAPTNYQNIHKQNDVLAYFRSKQLA